MEERKLELDDDGKIKIKKAKSVLDEDPSTEDEDIVLEVPDFAGFGEEEDGGVVTEQVLQQRDAEHKARLKDNKERAEELFSEAETLFEAGDLVGAGEKYLDSASLYGSDWRPWFGVVRVQTHDFTQFEGIYECEQAYDKAFRRMTKADRAALAERYVPSLEKQADFCAAESEKFNAQDVSERESSREEIASHYKKSSLLLLICSLFTILFAVGGGILSKFVRSVPDNSILIPCILCAVAALVMLVISVLFLKKFVNARVARRNNLRAGTTAAGDRARVYAETEELIRSIVEDLQK